MTMTTTQESGWRDLERLGVSIGRPPRRRDKSGRWVRADGGEWDFFYSLADSERDYIRRHFLTADGAPVDSVALAAGFDDVEEWAEQWVTAIRLTRPDRGDWERQWDDGDWYAGVVAPSPGVLVGPAEVAELLGVRPATVHQWVARDLLPAPWDIVSGTRLWPRHEILAWAEETGRLPEEAEVEAF